MKTYIVIFKDGSQTQVTGYNIYQAINKLPLNAIEIISITQLNP